MGLLKPEVHVSNLPLKVPAQAGASQGGWTVILRIFARLATNFYSSQNRLRALRSCNNLSQLSFEVLTEYITLKDSFEALSGTYYTENFIYFDVWRRVVHCTSICTELS